MDLTSGARVVINDPVGRFGVVHDQWPLFTADTDNPSIRASTVSIYHHRSRCILDQRKTNIPQIGIPGVHSSHESRNWR